MEIVDYDQNDCIIVTKNSKKQEDDFYQGFSRPKATDFFYLQNTLHAVTESGEYYHDIENGILYYYPYIDNDGNPELNETWFAVADHVLNFNGLKDVSFQDLGFMYTTGTALEGQQFSKLNVENCIFKHCETGIGIINSNSTVYNHLLIEDSGAMAVGFNGMKNSGMNNSIIRGFGMRIFANGMNYWGENNFTYITNCDFSDGFSSAIIYGDGAYFDNSKIQYTLLSNNHIHHLGYRVVDDIGGFFFGQHPPGNIVDHNCVHDVYVHNYCGNGIYSDTGSNGAKVMNNLVYDVDNAAWNMNGMEHEIYNNIFAYSGNMASFGETREGHHIMNLHNNIMYLAESNEVIGGDSQKANKVTFENNLYYREDNKDLTFFGESFNEWRKKGHDLQSIIEDPHFKDPKKRDFSFSSTSTAEKIGFIPFNTTFGVIENEWRTVAEDHKYHEPITLYPRVPMTGNESFERGNKADIFYRINIINDSGKVELTDEKASDGKYSLKFTAENENAHPQINFYLGFTDGNGSVSFKIFPSKSSDFWLDFWTGSWINFFKGQIRYGWKGGDPIGSYEEGKWLTITVKCECHTSYNVGWLTFQVDDKLYNVSVGESNRPLEYARIWDDSGIIYLDDLQINIDTPDPPLFANEILEEYENNNGEESKGFSTYRRNNWDCNCCCCSYCCCCVCIHFML